MGSVRIARRRKRPGIAAEVTVAAKKKAGKKRAKAKSTTPAKKKQLTPKQSVFVDEYIVDFNATQAAIRAGYSERTAHSQGPRLLENVEVAKAIAQRMKNRSERTEITQDMVLSELAKLAFSNMEDFSKVDAAGVASLNLRGVTRDQMAAVTELTTDTIGAMTVRTKLKLADKRGNLELVGKHLGMFKPVGGADNPLTFAPQEPDLSSLSDDELQQAIKLRRKVGDGS